MALRCVNKCFLSKQNSQPLDIYWSDLIDEESKIKLEIVTCF